VPVLESRIIERGSNEVNGRSRLRASSAMLALASLVLSLTLSCSRESRAEALLDEARTEVQRQRIAEAVAIFERVVREYGGTEAAGRAREALFLYRGLLEAERLDPLRRARDVLVQTARRIEQWRAAHGAWPSTMEDPVLDPWGRPLAYERTEGGYRLASWGADGSPGGEPDLVVVNGRFQEDPLGGNP
jgi:hypothetical protein